jgi:hypothetical protein
MAASPRSPVRIRIASSTPRTKTLPSPIPPVLVAGIYGMNFRVMPELQWSHGYPMALGLVVVSALIPFLWFKRRGWM